MKVNTFKRLESSIQSFNQTLEGLVNRLEEMINLLKSNSQHTINSFVAEDMGDDMLEAITVGIGQIKIKLFDIDHVKWFDDLEYDLSILTGLLLRSVQFCASRDEKLNMLKGSIQKKIKNPINPDNLNCQEKHMSCVLSHLID